MNKFGRNARATVLLLAGSVAFAGMWKLPADSSQKWKFSKESEALVTDAKLRDEIFDALAAAEKVGTDPGTSHFNVRVATAFEKDGKERVVVGGNSEYQLPEGIHGETSVLNHVIVLYGPETTRHDVRFLAFFANQCGASSCGDCRDYQLATTDYERLLFVCGQTSDRMVKVTRFADQIVCERNFPEVDVAEIPLTPEELRRLVQSAEEARRGGVTLFTKGRHTGTAALSFAGKTYRSAGADDAAFHYRYPIGGVLQQAMTERDYFLRAIVVSGEKGEWPVVNYRDRQYGYEASSFNHAAGKAPIVLILSNGRGQFRMTTFESALPNAFSTADFMPEALKTFLASHTDRK